MFGPKGNRTEARVSAGLMFPGLELQVYQVSQRFNGNKILFCGCQFVK